MCTVANPSKSPKHFVTLLPKNCHLTPNFFTILSTRGWGGAGGRGGEGEAEWGATATLEVYQPIILDLPLMCLPVHVLVVSNQIIGDLSKQFKCAV